jgi:hypothetical protein
MTKYQLGLRPGQDTAEETLFQGLTAEQRSRAFDYETMGFGTLGLIVDALRGTDEDARRLREDWENRLLIQHQGILFAYGYNQEQQRNIRRHLEELRKAGRYAEEFALYDCMEVQHER